MRKGGQGGRKDRGEMGLGLETWAWASLFTPPSLFLSALLSNILASTGRLSESREPATRRLSESRELACL